MDSLQTDSTVRALLFHLRVCGPHVNFRGVDCKALAVVGRCWSVSLSFSYHIYIITYVNLWYKHILQCTRFSSLFVPYIGTYGFTSACVWYSSVVLSPPCPRYLEVQERVWYSFVVPPPPVHALFEPVCTIGMYL